MSVYDNLNRQIPDRFFILGDWQSFTKPLNLYATHRAGIRTLLLLEFPFCLMKVK